MKKAEKARKVGNNQRQQRGFFGGSPAAIPGAATIFCEHVLMFTLFLWFPTLFDVKFEFGMNRYPWGQNGTPFSTVSRRWQIFRLRYFCPPSAVTPPIFPKQLVQLRVLVGFKKISIGGPENPGRPQPAAGKEVPFLQYRVDTNDYIINSVGGPMM